MQIFSHLTVRGEGNAAETFGVGKRSEHHSNSSRRTARIADARCKRCGVNLIILGERAVGFDSERGFQPRKCRANNRE